MLHSHVGLNRDDIDFQLVSFELNIAVMENVIFSTSAGSVLFCRRYSLLALFAILAAHAAHASHAAHTFHTTHATHASLLHSIHSHHHSAYA